MRRGTRNVAVATLVIAASLSLPLSASAESDGAIEVGVVIAPVEGCITDCVTSPATGELSRTGLDPALATALAVGLGAAGLVTLVVANARKRSRSGTQAAS